MLSKTVTPYKSVKAITPSSDFPLSVNDLVSSIPANKAILDDAIHAITSNYDLAKAPICIFCYACQQLDVDHCFDKF